MMAARHRNMLQKVHKIPLDKLLILWYNIYVKKRSSKGYLFKSPIPWGSNRSTKHRQKAKSSTARGRGNPLNQKRVLGRRKRPRKKARRGRRASSYTTTLAR